MIAEGHTVANTDKTKKCIPPSNQKKICKGSQPKRKMNAKSQGRTDKSDDAPGVVRASWSVEDDGLLMMRVTRLREI